MREISLYIHIPFCVQICHYCDFAVTRIKGEGKNAQLDSYVQALIKEITERLSSYDSLSIPSIYFGGGTPSLLRPQDWETIFAALLPYIQKTSTCEITMEANPETVTPELSKVWQSHGINRISLGAQSFNDTTLVSLGRLHTASQIGEAVKILKGSGFKNIGLDLIYGLPKESYADFMKSCTQAIELDTQHISLYQLAIEEKTIFHVKHSKGELPLPTETTLLKEYEDACSHLEDAGFIHYELQNFSKLNNRSIHNIRYWQGRELLGFGVGAYSYVDSTRFGHGKNPSAYIKNCEAGNFAPLTSEVIGEETKMRERIILGLRMREGIDLSTLENEGIRIPETIEEELDGLTQEKLLTKKDRHFTLTLKGEHLSDWVSSHLV